MKILLFVSCIGIVIVVLFLYAKLREYFEFKRDLRHQDRYYAYLYLIKNEWTQISDLREGKKEDFYGKLDILSCVFRLAEVKNWPQDGNQYADFINEAGRIRTAVETVSEYYSMGLSNSNSDPYTAMRSIQDKVQQIESLDIRNEDCEQLKASFILRNIDCIRANLLRYYEGIPKVSKHDSMQILDWLIPITSSTEVCEKLVAIKTDLAKREAA